MRIKTSLRNCNPPETSCHTLYPPGNTASPEHQPSSSLHNLCVILHRFLFFPPQIELDSSLGHFLSHFLRPQMPSPRCYPEYFFAYVGWKLSTTRKASLSFCFPAFPALFSALCLPFYNSLRSSPLPHKHCCSVFPLLLAVILLPLLPLALKHLISITGLDPAHYSPHSFQCSGTTLAFQSGIPEHLIKLQWLVIGCLLRIPGAPTGDPLPGCRRHDCRVISKGMSLNSVNTAYLCMQFKDTKILRKTFSVLFSASHFFHKFSTTFGLFRGVIFLLNDNISAQMCVFIDWHEIVALFWSRIKEV